MANVNRRSFLAGLGIAAVSGAAFALAGCASDGAKDEAEDAPEEDAAPEEEPAEEGDKTIVVAATPSPHAEILTDVVKGLLEADGWTLDVKEFTDYVLPNTATEEGEVDANYFQHEPYLDSFNEEKGTHLVSVAKVHFEPMGLFAGKTASLDELADGAKVGVPNDTTNEARALLLLQQEGLITLAEDAGITATVNDIVDNPLNLDITELNAEAIPQTLPDLDVAVINGNYALPAGLKLTDALAAEAADGLAAETYGNIICVKEGNEETDKTKALVAAILSDDVKKYIEDNYEGAVVAVF